MRFLDEHWYRSMQLKGCERDFTVDPRVASDPDGLREEVFPRWYVLAFHWTLEDREGEYDPPVDSDVRERLERYVESRMEYARMTFPDVVPMVSEPDLFAFGYVTQTQYDVIEEVSRYWSSVYDERVRLDKELADECKHAMGRRMRYFGMHDATVSVTRDGGSIRMECRNGLSIPELIVFEDATVVQGRLPDRFWGLYQETYWRDGRFEVGFLADGEDGRIEFTITSAGIRMYNSAGVEITDDYDHDMFYARNNLTHCGSQCIWERDPENRTYRRVCPMKVGIRRLY